MVQSNAWWVNGGKNPHGDSGKFEITANASTPKVKAPWWMDGSRVRPQSNADWVHKRTFEKKLEDCENAKKKILAGNGKDSDAFHVISWDAAGLLERIKANSIAIEPAVESILVKKAEKFASKVNSVEYTC